MKRIIVRLQGGLGNQLFQLAYAKKQYEENEFEEVVLDISYFEKKHIRNLELDKIEIDPNIIMKSQSGIWAELLYAVYRGISKIYYKLNIGEFQMLIRMGKREYFFCGREPKEYTIKKNTRYCAGYYQNCKIADFIKYDDYIVKNMGENAMFYCDEIKRCEETIAVSIRMGEDYYKFGWPVCEKEYYVEGIKRLLAIHPKSSIFVFSDCIKDVESEKWFANFEQVVLVKDIDAAEGIALMKECDNFVISNSTFAWWGAHLSSNDDKLIIAPNYFYYGKVMKGSVLDKGNMIFLDNVSGKIVE